MGNLRDKYTDEEWTEIQNKIKTDRANGKPDEDLLYLSIWNKELKELKELRNVLSDYFSDYDLSLLDKWISWKNKNK